MRPIGAGLSAGDQSALLRRSGRSGSAINSRVACAAVFAADNLRSRAVVTLASRRYT
jgi:hypothetical protein